jgi:hypothetical protein
LRYVQNIVGTLTANEWDVYLKWLGHEQKMDLVRTRASSGWDTNRKWITIGYLEAHKPSRRKKCGMETGRRK